VQNYNKNSAPSCHQRSSNSWGCNTQNYQWEQPLNQPKWSLRHFPGPTKVAQGSLYHPIRMAPAPVWWQHNLRGHLSTLLWAIQKSLIFYTLCHIQYAHTNEDRHFIDAGQIHLIFRGTKPIYTGNFNELVDKQSPNANFITRWFLSEWSHSTKTETWDPTSNGNYLKTGTFLHLCFVLNM